MCWLWRMLTSVRRLLSISSVDAGYPCIHMAAQNPSTLQSETSLPISSEHLVTETPLVFIISRCLYTGWAKMNKSFVALILHMELSLIHKHVVSHKTALWQKPWLQFIEKTWNHRVRSAFNSKRIYSRPMSQLWEDVGSCVQSSCTFVKFTGE